MPTSAVDARAAMPLPSELAAALAAAWPLSASPTIHVVQTGLNNPTYRVVSGPDRYALRVYQNLTEAALVAREHVLLATVERGGLPFAVPAPVRTRRGTTMAQSPFGWLALFRWIPGSHPDRDRPRHLHALGRAVADLDVTLGALDAELHRALPGAPTSTHGTLDRIHPAVPDPFALATTLARAAGPDAIDACRWWDVTLTEVAAAAPHWYRSLPQQWVHQDMAVSNALQARGRITGLLDFEFAERDLRVIDLVALLANVVLDWSSPRGWTDAAAVCSGYASRLRLTSAEVEAVPGLLRLRWVVSVLHGAGRWLAGLTTEAEVARRLRHAVESDRALADRQERLRMLVLGGATPG